MREFIKKIKSAKEINDSVTLDLFQRVKCRIKAVTDSGCLLYTSDAADE